MELKNQTEKFTHILVIIILSVVVICNFYFNEENKAAAILKTRRFDNMDSAVIIRALLMQHLLKLNIGSRDK